MSEVKAYQYDTNYSNIEKLTDAIKEDFLSDLEDIVKPSQKIVLKPNFVRQSHLNRPNDWEYVITHPSIIRIVLEKVVELLRGEGEVLIVDAPQTDSDYEEIIRRIGLKSIVESVQQTTTVRIEFFDLREEQWIEKNGVTVRVKKLTGDPAGYVSVNLGKNSAFYDKKNKEYYGADYDRSETMKYHNDADNIYVMSKTILESDVFINLPKMKTHKLGGVTGCLKNVVGTCAIKNSIPHHTVGSPDIGGDRSISESGKAGIESRIKNVAYNLMKKKKPLINYSIAGLKYIAGFFLGSRDSNTVRNGSWYGNDTIWRSIIDLNKIILYVDKEGVLCEKPQRKYYAVVDGVVAGEGEGPMAPDPKPCGLLLAGNNPVCVDAVMATLMGFDWKKIPSIREAMNSAKASYPLTNETECSIVLRSNQRKWDGKVLCGFQSEETLLFRPHFGWIGHIEY